jgi:hypothetical protein
VQLTRRCKPRHASADDDNINDCFAGGAAVKLSQSADHHCRIDQSFSTIEEELKVFRLGAADWGKQVLVKGMDIGTSG